MSQDDYNKQRALRSWIALALSVISLAIAIVNLIT